MPEGDTVEWHRARLAAALVGHPLIRIDGVAPVRRWAPRLRGRTVNEVTRHGKHLVIGVDGTAIRVHLGMTGRWRIVDDDARLGSGDRLLLGTAAQTAICAGAPTIEVGPRRSVLAALAHLGPDLLDPEVDLDTITARAAAESGRPLVSVLLDQRVAAGIGNVIALEALHRAGVAPATPVDQVPVARLRYAYEMAQRFLRANAGRPVRVTTGDPGAGRRHWVYDRAGRPCRRCGTAIVARPVGDPPRLAFWCPRCQGSTTGS